MKKSRKLLLTLLTTVLLLPITNPVPARAADSSSEIVHFTDSKLEKAISEKLNKQNSTITKSDMEQITELELYNKPFTSLSEIKYCTNLKHLELFNCMVPNYDFLKNLTGLTDLKIENMNFSDLTPISNLYNLKVLHIDNRGFGYMPSWEGLETPHYDKNSLSDISLLSRFGNLSDLNLNNNNISDISSLANLRNLKKLDLSTNPISDISPLSNLTNLTNLNLSYDKISDISPIFKLNNLKSIFACDQFINLKPETCNGTLTITNPFENSKLQIMHFRGSSVDTRYFIDSNDEYHSYPYDVPNSPLTLLDDNVVYNKKSNTVTWNNLTKDGTLTYRFIKNESINGLSFEFSGNVNINVTVNK